MKLVLPFLLLALLGRPITGATEECETNADGTTTCQQEKLENAPATTKKFQHLRFCEDRIDDCVERLTYTPNGCIRYFDFMSKVCAKTCQICSNKDPNLKTIANHHFFRTCENCFCFHISKHNYEN